MNTEFQEFNLSYTLLNAKLEISVAHRHPFKLIIASTGTGQLLLMDLSRGLLLQRMLLEALLLSRHSGTALSQSCKGIQQLVVSIS